MKIKTLYFSPTGNTKKVVNGIAKGIIEKQRGVESDIQIQKKDLTTPFSRTKLPLFTQTDIVVVGVPVYGGRIPQILLPTLESLEGNHAIAIAVVTYGVRAYDDALLELRDLLEKKHFNVIGAAAIIGEHSLTRKVGTDRPNANDLEECYLYGRKIADKYMTSISKQSPSLTQESVGEDDFKQEKNIYSLEHIKGNYPNLPNSPQFITENLVTTDACTNCGICSNLCPTGAISPTNQKLINLDQCIRCHACVKNCPVMAKYFQDSRIEKSKNWLEEKCNIYKENEFYI